MPNLLLVPDGLNKNILQANGVTIPSPRLSAYVLI